MEEVDSAFTVHLSPTSMSQIQITVALLSAIHSKLVDCYYEWIGTDPEAYDLSERQGAWNKYTKYRDVYDWLAKQKPPIQGFYQKRGFESVVNEVVMECVKSSPISLDS